MTTRFFLRYCLVTAILLFVWNVTSVSAQYGREWQLSPFTEDIDDELNLFEDDVDDEYEDGEDDVDDEYEDGEDDNFLPTSKGRYGGFGGDDEIQYEYPPAWNFPKNRRDQVRERSLGNHHQTKC